MRGGRRSSYGELHGLEPRGRREYIFDVLVCVVRVKRYPRFTDALIDFRNDAFRVFPIDVDLEREHVRGKVCGNARTGVISVGPCYGFRGFINGGNKVIFRVSGFRECKHVADLETDDRFKRNDASGRAGPSRERYDGRGERISASQFVSGPVCRYAVFVFVLICGLERERRFRRR